MYILEQKTIIEKKSIVKTYVFFMFLRKMKEKKLPNEYELLFIPKDYDPPIDTFIFTRHLFG